MNHGSRSFGNASENAPLECGQARVLRKIFRSFDRNGDGLLSFGEIREGLQQAAGWGHMIEAFR